MIPFLCVLLSGVSGRGFSLNAYSAVVSVVSGSSLTATGVVSMVPDPNTGQEQPIVALNMSAPLNAIMVGGLRSYVGGMAQLPLSAFSGDRSLDLFDFSRGGWPSLRSTVVAKQGSITLYSANCSISTGCLYPYGFNLVLATDAGSNITLVVDSRRNVPLSINITLPYPGQFFSWSFDQFDTHASTFQPDASIYVLPSAFYTPATPVPRPSPNVSTVSFYRSFSNDSFARNLANDNAANAVGEANWICPSPGQGVIIAQFDVTVDTNFGPYAPCNKGACSCNHLSDCQRVGRQAMLVPTSFWYSFPQSAMCARGHPIGANNCTWLADYKLVAAITADCFINVKGDPAYPNGFLPSCDVDAVGQHIVYALHNCPDVKDSLRWPEPNSW